MLSCSLKSPQFLYPDIASDGAPDAHRVAARLALGLWDSLPDTELVQAAKENRLTTREKIARQARRMLSDPRARTKMRAFFHHWLEVDSGRDLLKDSEAYPEFTSKTIADLRHSLNLFVDQVVWSEKSDYRELLLANYLPLNRELAKLYGKKVDKSGFQRIEFEQNRRSGVLTHPYLLAAFSYPDSSSPIHRGVFLTRHIVGRPLKPPKDAAVFQDADFEPGMTMREKVTELTRDAACMNCHATINPLGFSLESYDGIGRWRTQDNNKTIDTTTEYETEDGKKIHLKGARDIAEFAAGSRVAHRAFITHLFTHLIKALPFQFMCNKGGTLFLR